MDNSKPPINIQLTSTSNPEAMPDSIWDLLGWLLGWLVYAYFWLAGADITIYFVRSGYDIQSTLFHALWLCVYPFIWVLGSIFGIGYSYLYCPLSHAWAVITGTKFNVPVLGVPPFDKPSFKEWIWPWAKNTTEVKDIEADIQEYDEDFDPEYPDYCGPNKKKTCAGYSKTLGRIEDIFSVGYWVCHNTPEQQQRNCVGGGTNCSANITYRGKTGLHKF